jgi:Leucine-rich repeat (LRR) protein
MEQPQGAAKESTTDEEASPIENSDDKVIKVPRGTTKRRWKIVYLSGILVALFFCVSIIYLSIVLAHESHASNSDGDEDPVISRDPETLRNAWRIYHTTLVEQLNPIDVEIATKLANPATAEWKALQWLMIHDDTIFSSMVINEDKIDAPVFIQRFALVTIFLHFCILDWMVPRQHECEWIGVSCAENHNITALNLTSTPAMAENVTSDANVTAAMLGTTVPVALSYLSNSLLSLDLSQLALKGTIPYACYQQWNNLQYLNLDQNQLQRFFTPLQATKRISALMPSIQYVNVRNNLLQESVLFDEDESGTNNAAASLTILSDWHDLRYLDVRGNTGLVGPLLEYGLPHWINIETLQLTETSLTGTVPSVNVSLSNLKTLEAWRVPFSGTLPAALTTATNLESLSLGWSDQLWTGTLPESYAALTQLRVLSLSYLNGITGTLPAAWGTGLTALQSMDLFGNTGLIGSIPTSWGQMTSLFTLRLSETGITGTIPTELGLCTQLVDVSLYRTQLHGSMPSEVCRLREAPFFLGKLSVDCAETSLGSNDAPVACSRPDCCTICTQLTPV